MDYKVPYKVYEYLGGYKVYKDLVVSVALFGMGGLVVECVAPAHGYLAHKKLLSSGTLQ